MARIDHLVYAVPDLDVGIEQFAEATGIRPAMGGAHVGLGTHNALVSFGSSYLELIAPDPNQPEPLRPRPFGIDQLADSAFVAFAVRPGPGESIDALAQSAADAGHDTGPVTDMQRATPDGGLLAWRLTITDSEMPAVVPFLIDWGTTPLPSTTQPGGVELTSFRARHPEPGVLGGVYAALGLAVPITLGDAGFDVTITGPAGMLTS